MSANRDHYEVGKGKPPKKDQYRPGQSGNPKGRPKKPSDLEGHFNAVLREKVTVYIGGKKKRLTKAELLAKQAFTEATSSRAGLARVAMINLFLKHADSTVPTDPQGRSPEELREAHKEVNKILAQWLKMGMISPPEAVEKAMQELNEMDTDDFEQGRTKVLLGLVYSKGPTDRSGDVA